MIFKKNSLFINENVNVHYFHFFKILVKTVLFNNFSKKIIFSKCSWRLMVVLNRYGQKRRRNIIGNFVKRVAKKYFNIANTYANSVQNIFYKSLKNIKYKDPVYFLKDGYNCPLVEVRYKNTWKPCYIGNKFCFPISGNLSEKVFRFSFIILDNYPLKLIGSMFKFDFKMVDSDTNVIYKQSLSVPTIKKKQNAVYHSIGSGFVNLEISLPSKKENAELIVSTCLETTNSENSKSTTNYIGMASPQILVKKLPDDTSRILILSVESLADQGILKNRYNGITEKHFYEMINSNDFKYYSNGYSQGDFTLHSLSCFFTGLRPSQTGMGIRDPERSLRLTSHVPTLAEIAKRNNIVTYAQLFGSETYTSGDLGFARGFDSYETVRHNNIYRLLDFFEKNREYESMAFMNLNCLHVPLSVPIDPKGNDDAKHYSEDEVISRDLTYNNGLKELGAVFSMLIACLKERNIYDNTLIIVTGDHGCGLEPWGDHKENPLYEERVRVPFAVKLNEGARKVSPPLVQKGKPFNASATVHQLTREFLGDNTKEKHLCPIQYYDNHLGAYALVESTHRPENGDYVSALISAKYKYQFFARVDWENNEIKDVYSKRLFVKDERGFFDETQNVIGSFNEIANRFYDLAKNNLDKSLEFYRLNPASIFTT